MCASLGERLGGPEDALFVEDRLDARGGLVAAIVIQWFSVSIVAARPSASTGQRAVYPKLAAS